MRKGCRNRARVYPIALVVALEPRLLFHDAPDAADGGLVGTYFDNADFTAPVLTRTDNTINFYWGAESPAPPLGADTFSVRWTGNVIPHTTEPYTLTVRADGGAKLIINGQPIIDALDATPDTFIEHSGTIALTEDVPVAIQIDYVEQTGASGVRLYWQTPTIAREVVPADHLDPGQVDPPLAPPTAPVSFATSPISVSQTRLTWTDTASNEDGFEILRSANLGPAAVVGTAGANAAEFIDSGLTPGVRYFYRIRATSPIGDSEWADYANTLADGVGEPLQPPAAPSDLTATVGANSIGLTWTGNSADETQFVISRRSGTGSAFEDVATLGADTTSYTDTDVSPGVTYDYRVRARSLIGDSAASNSVEATIPIVGEPTDNFTQINWTTGKSGPIARTESLTTVIDGKLYLFAGFDSNVEPMSRVDVFDPVANTWTRLHDMPTRLTHAGTATVGRSVYFAGGYIGVGDSGGHQMFAVVDVWRYDVDTDNYSKMPDLPVRRGGGALVALGNELHYFGGNNSDRQDVADHHVLNLDGGTQWTTAAPMLNGRSHMGYAALNGKIYAIGGQHGNDEALTTQGDVDVYDPATDVWTKLTSIPQAVSHMSSSTFVMGDRILVLGGETKHQAAISTVWAYDPADDTWTELTPLPSARRSGVAGVIDGVLYYTAGSKTTATFVGKPVARQGA